MIRSVTISSYYINTPAGGEKRVYYVLSCLNLFFTVYGLNERTVFTCYKKTELALLKCVPNLLIN